MRLTRPYLDAAVVEEFFDGTDLSTIGTVYRALSATEQNILIPSINNVDYQASGVYSRFTIVLPEARPVDRLAIEGVPIESAPTVSVAAFDGTNFTNIVSDQLFLIDDDCETTNMIIRFPERTSDIEYSVTFQQLTEQTQMQNIFIGTLGWEPDDNYNWGSQQLGSPVLEERQTETSNRFRVTDRTRRHTLQFDNQSETTVENLNKLLTRRLKDGYCLYERDKTTDELWFLASVQGTAMTPQQAFNYSISITATEIDEWL